MLKHINKIFLYINTLRYLKHKQIFYRLIFIIKNKKKEITHVADLVEKRPYINNFRTSLIKSTSFNPNLREFEFLNKKFFFNTFDNWHPKDMSKLWIYNLHYFDYLNSNLISTSKKNDLYLLINSWIDSNKSLTIGWEPYPSSLRIVNWIKFFINNKTDEKKYFESLYDQLNHLSNNIEYHIMGNHLIANAKALIFGGIFFKCSQSKDFLDAGLRILNEQLEEQILADGGHFELSPMYHQIILEDILDLINLYLAYNIDVPEIWIKNATLMQEWATVMAHPDEDIPFFNDSAFSIAPKPVETRKECLKCDIPLIDEDYTCKHLEDSGYVVYKGDNIKMIMDCGPIGPDYIPGHGHCDLQSFELSIFGKRLIVNGGTSTYDISPKRVFERSSSSHSTIEINGKNSSEVWSSFRVARRSNPLKPIIKKDNKTILVTSINKGFNKFFEKVVNKRTWKIMNNKIKIIDSIAGKQIPSRTKLIIHPSWKFKQIKECVIILVSDNKENEVSISSKEPIKIEDFLYSSEFGKTIKTKSIIQSSFSKKFEILISW